MEAAACLRSVEMFFHSNGQCTIRSLPLFTEFRFLLRPRICEFRFKTLWLEVNVSLPQGEFRFGIPFAKKRERDEV